MVTDQLWFLCGVLPVAGGYGFLILYLITVQRTLNLVRPEHRQADPVFIWLSLVPFFGLLNSIVLVGAIEESLRKQFTALGEHRPGDRYGIGAGLLWTLSPVIAATALCSGACSNVGGQTGAVLVATFFMALVCATVAGFVWHWIIVERCRQRLARHFSGATTQDEMDYADDLPPPGGPDSYPNP